MTKQEKELVKACILDKIIQYRQANNEELANKLLEILKKMED